MENPLKIDPKRDQKNDRRLEYVLGRLRENLGGFWRISGGSGGGGQGGARPGAGFRSLKR